MLILDMTCGCFIGSEMEPITQRPAMSAQSSWIPEQAALQLAESEPTAPWKPSVGVLANGMRINRFGFED